MESPGAALPRAERRPDIDELLTVLGGGVPSRPVLFEIYINNEMYALASGEDYHEGLAPIEQVRIIASAFARLGYDYAAPWPRTITDFAFPTGERHKAKSISQNEGALISDWESFERYPWPDPGAAWFAGDRELLAVLPEGMRLVLMVGGVFEAAVSLFGAQNLCLMVYDDPELVSAVFDAVGSRRIQVHERLASYESVAGIVVADDWGFKTQTLLSPDDMRRFNFPWHARIVETIHAAGKPAIVHSCGNAGEIMDDVIDTMRYDGRHSYEDTIVPVEEAYERWGDRIATIGGIDVDFLCSAGPEAVTARCRSMLDRASGRGGYALGSGNSIPTYVPQENYLAMVRAGLE
jgi:uroporphyrinogen decarboxylase